MAELRTLVLEGGKFIPTKHQSIFLNLFELENMTVDDTMTPRGQIEAIDLEDDIDDIRTAISTAHHTRLVVFEGSLDKVAGILHVRKFLNASRREQLDKDGIREILREPYFVPEGTPLLTQLTNFQEQMRHMGLVVDEYGEILGLVTLQDILEEIVGEFTSQKPMSGSLLCAREPDGSRDRRGRLPAARAQPQGRIPLPARGAQDDQRPGARGARGHPRGRHGAHRRRPPRRDPAGAEPHGEGGAHPRAQGRPAGKAQAA